MQIDNMYMVLKKSNYQMYHVDLGEGEGIVSPRSQCEIDLICLACP